MDLTLYTLRSVASAIIGPSIIVVILLGVMFYFKNKKISFMQKMIVGESINSPLELTLSQIVLGIFAGAIGSLLLTYFGIMFNENSRIEWLFLVSMLLMLYKPRFVCFSYSGAIIGALTLILTFIYGDQSPIKLDIVHLVMFVGIIHIVEGFLVIIDGSRGAIPVFTNKNGKILGGFALNRYWSLPIAVLIIMNSSGSYIGTQSVGTPDWWPILNHSYTLDILKTAIIGLFPYYGVVGYSSITFSSTKREKTLLSGSLISLYGILLCGVALIAGLGIAGSIIALIFMPLAHEAMLRLSSYIEEKKSPIYTSDEEGICVLEVAPRSPAFDVGIKSGDKILRINEEIISNEAEIYKIVKESFNDVKLKVKNINGIICDYTLKPDINRRIGVVLVPKMVKQEDAMPLDNDFRSVLEKVRNRKNNKE
ncbi:Cell division topological determinant MinJ [compost metagenome]